eukprot:17435-Rhodomonas_salina.1
MCKTNGAKLVAPAPIDDSGRLYPLNCNDENENEHNYGKESEPGVCAHFCSDVCNTSSLIKEAGRPAHQESLPSSQLPLPSSRTCSFFLVCCQGFHMLLSCSNFIVTGFGGLPEFRATLRVPGYNVPGYSGSCNRS